MSIEQLVNGAVGDLEDLTEEELQQVITGIVAGVYSAILAYEKVPKAVPTKGRAYNYLPRGLNQSRGFQDIPEDWAESYRVDPPVKVHERRLTADELSQGAAIRPMASQVQEDRAWLPNKAKHSTVCGPWAKHHWSSCPFRKPREIEKPNPTLAIWKRDGRRALGGSWVDPEDGVRVGGHPIPDRPAWSHEDILAQREAAARKWKPWTSERDAIVLLEANMIAAINGARPVEGRS